MSALIPALVALRPRQWVKNLFVFAGLIFSQSLFTPLIWPALGAFATFCALSGAIYVFNDVADVEKDRLHPNKRYRPIARGALSIPAALTLGVVLLVGSLVLWVEELREDCDGDAILLRVRQPRRACSDAERSMDTLRSA